MSSNVVFRKNGGFYSVYGDDCYILYYLFKYRIIDDRVGFPISAYNKVVNVLNENLINHQYNDDVVNYKKKIIIISLLNQVKRSIIWIQN